jgi:hypothetical protein
MASAHVSPLPLQQRAVHFSPPTQDSSALPPNCDEKAKVSSAGAKASRLFAKSKSGSNSFHASGSFHAAKTPKMLFPQTPTPIAGVHPKFEWNSVAGVPQGALAESEAPAVPPTYAAAQPAMLLPPSPAPQMMWVPMPQQPLMMQMQGGVPAAPPPKTFMTGENNAAAAGDRDANALPTLLGQSGLPSVGSALHGTGRCQPCAWFWKAGRGCQDGAKCDHCHLCPEGELKFRKKAKVAAMRMGLL